MIGKHTCLQSWISHEMLIKFPAHIQMYRKLIESNWIIISVQMWANTTAKTMKKSDTIIDIDDAYKKARHPISF